MPNKLWEMELKGTKKQSLNRRREHVFKKCEQLRRLYDLDVACYTSDRKTKKNKKIYQSEHFSDADKSLLHVCLVI
jgi:hypothetical protein